MPAPKVPKSLFDLRRVCEGAGGSLMWPWPLEFSEAQAIVEYINRVEERLAQAIKLQDLTLENELRWMRKHDELGKLVASLRDWKSPDGVLQVKDLKWFKDLNV